MNRLPRTLVVAALVVLSVTVSSPAATARESRGGGWRPHSFEGQCSLEGTVTFDPGATFVQQDLTLDSHLDGTCSGTLDGEEVVDVPVAMHNAGRSSGSCLHAETLEPGPGTLTFAGGPTIHYTFEFNWIGTDGVMRFEGRRLGLAVAHGTFRDPGLSGEGSKCATTGVTQTGITIELVTESPLVSACKVQGHRTRCK